MTIITNYFVLILSPFAYLRNVGMGDNINPSFLRAILMMRKRDGMTYQEIARHLEISVHTVKKYLLRAVAWCRQYEQQQNGGAA